MYSDKYLIILGLLIIVLFSIALPNTDSQEPNLIGEKNSSHFIRRWLGNPLVRFVNPKAQIRCRKGKEGLWKLYRCADGLAHNWVIAILQDHQGAMWFGTYDGVRCFDGTRWKNYTKKDGLAHNHVHAIFQDNQGAMWFGTYGGGISRFDGEEWKTYTKEDGLAYNYTKTLTQDREGTLWFGTYGGGVSRFDGRCFQSIDHRDGLANDILEYIYVDKSGQIWLSTRFCGVTRFIPNKVPPTVHVTQVRADEKTYRNPDERLKLRPGVKRVAFGFHASSFKTYPGKMKYFYQLVGEDLDWRGPTSEDTIEYFNLKPGSYTFQVQAVDRDLNYSEISSLVFTLPTLWHQVTWIRGTLAASAAILLTTLIILATALVKRRRQIRAYEKAAVQELQDANRVQMGLMPETAPSVEGVEIAGKCVPANTVSGDFFDYLEGKQKNEITLVVADVMGKAMKGAMNAMMTDGILRMAAKKQAQLSPASLLMEVNDILKARTERLMNVTMVIGMVDALNKTLTIANAGALPLLLREGEILTLKSGDLPLGMITGLEYTEEHLPLQSGDVVILMTDGIIEVQNSAEQFYSESGRLEKTISQFTLDMSAEAMIDTIIEDAIDFGGDKESRDDDMTVVVAKIQ